MYFFSRTLLLLLLCLSAVLNAQTTVRFLLNEGPPGEPSVVGVRGNLAPLSWERTLPLQRINGQYVTSLRFSQVGETLEFKFVHQSAAAGEVNWEGVDNRTVLLAEDSTIYTGRWNEPQFVDYRALPPIPVADLMADYELIETVFRDVHPGTYRYLTEEELNEELARLRERFSTPLTLAEAYLAINKFTAAVRCGHTASPLYNQGPAVTSMLFYGKDKLPFAFRWREERMLVTQDASTEKILPPGSEVVAINGTPVTAILRELRQYVGSDGPATDPLDGMLSLRAYPWRLEAFDALYHLVYPVPADGFLLSVRSRPGAEVTEVRVAPLRRGERAVVLADRYPDHPQKADDLWRLELLPDRTAILTVGDFTGFGLGALELDYRAFFAEAFTEMRKAGTDKLIIDVRENQGGNDPIVEELFSHLAHQPSQNAPFEGRMRYQRFPAQLRPYVKTWGNTSPSFFEPAAGRMDSTGRYYVYPQAFTRGRRQKVKPKAFAGEVVWLTGRINASLGFYLANTVKRNRLGTLIGETTGGSMRGINGGNLAMLRLPRTDLELDFPVLGGFALSPQPAHGVIPHIPIEPTAAQVVAGQDSVLAAALAHLAKLP